MSLKDLKTLEQLISLKVRKSIFKNTDTHKDWNIEIEQIAWMQIWTFHCLCPG